MKPSACLPAWRAYCWTGVHRRGAAGLIGLVRKGFFHSDEQVLFWHTGGTPALFAEPYAGQVASRYKLEIAHRY